MVHSVSSLSKKIKYSLLLLIAFVFGTLSILLVISLTKDFSLGRLGLLFFFALIANFSFHFGSKVFQKVKINTTTKTIESTFTSIYLQLITAEKGCQYTTKYSYVNHNKIETMIIVGPNGTRISFDSEQYKNYDELFKAAQSMGWRNEKLNTRILEITLRYVVAYAIILGVLFLSLKFMQMG